MPPVQVVVSGKIAAVNFQVINPARQSLVLPEGMT